MKLENKKKNPRNLRNINYNQKFKIGFNTPALSKSKDPFLLIGGRITHGNKLYTSYGKR